MRRMPMQNYRTGTGIYVSVAAEIFDVASSVLYMTAGVTVVALYPLVWGGRQTWLLTSTVTVPRRSIRLKMKWFDASDMK